MEGHGRLCSSTTPPSEEEMDLRRGPWTVDEDLLLMNYVNAHGEGRWNSLARCAGLRRTGKSCRLRWLNYLRPDVRRGNITPEEQLLILELHSRLGNRWSKIARHLPGRTDNEIKNYWRTRVQKHAKQLRCDVNSKQFKDIMRYIWMPRLVERIRGAGGGGGGMHSDTTALADSTPTHQDAVLHQQAVIAAESAALPNASCWEHSCSYSAGSVETTTQLSSPPVSAESYREQGGGRDGWTIQEAPPPSPGGFAYAAGLPDFEQGEWGESLWSVEDIWLQQQL